MTLEEFAEKFCDRMYNSKLGADEQCSGWYELKKMVQSDIQPNNENMSFFHPNLRQFLLENWSNIKIKFNG